MITIRSWILDHISFSCCKSDTQWNRVINELNKLCHSHTHRIQSMIIHLLSVFIHLFNSSCVNFSNGMINNCDHRFVCKCNLPRMWMPITQNGATKTFIKSFVHSLWVTFYLETYKLQCTTFDTFNTISSMKNGQHFQSNYQKATSTTTNLRFKHESFSFITNKCNSWTSSIQYLFSFVRWNVCPKLITSPHGLIPEPHSFRVWCYFMIENWRNSMG